MRASEFTVPEIGINVRSDGNIDYADLIVDGKKKLETRNSDSLRPYVGRRVSIIKTGKGRAYAIGVATVGEPIEVDEKQFRDLEKEHLVPAGSKFDIQPDSTKFLYPMLNPKRYERPREVGHGILSRKVFVEAKTPGQWTVDAILDVLPIAQEIWFHGSRAIGKHKRTSDTDILVVVPEDIVGESYLKVLRILQKLSSQYKGYDIQPSHSNSNIHLIAKEEGKLLYKKNKSVVENITVKTIHKLADRKGIPWDNEPSFLKLTKRLTGKEHLDDLDQAGLKKVQKYLEKQGVAEGEEGELIKPDYTFNVDRRKLNVPALIQKGAIFVTWPHGEQGWETDNKEDWAYSLISFYNVFHGGWPSEAKKYLKPISYKKAEQHINSSAPNLGSNKLVYDGKYNQILWSIKKLGIPDSVAFLDKQGVAEGSENSSGKLAWRIRFRRFKDMPSYMPEREGKVYLMPTDHSAVRTFGNLTGKDNEKITQMPTEAYLVSGDAMVGDMSIINAISRETKTNKDENRIEQLKKLYLNYRVPYSQYKPGMFKYPEILADPSQLQKLDKAVVYDKNTGEIVIKDK